MGELEIAGAAFEIKIINIEKNEAKIPAITT